MKDEPLEQFQTYYGSQAQRAVAGEAEYVRLREAFYAGHRARPAEPLEPSRTVLDGARRLEKARRFQQVYGVPPEKVRDLGEYAPEPLYDGLRPVGRQHGYLPAPGWDVPPDYVQHGTVTGRFPQRKPVPEELRRVEPVAGPDQATMERIAEQLRQKGVSEYPSPRPMPPADSTNPGFPAVDARPVGLEHVTTVWDGEMAPEEAAEIDKTIQFGSPGPVPTPLSLSEDADG